MNLPENSTSSTENKVIYCDRNICLKNSYNNISCENCEVTKSQEPTNAAHNLCDSCTNIECEFQSGIIRTECAFYIPPHIEPDNCGNYIIQESTNTIDYRRAFKIACTLLNGDVLYGVDRDKIFELMMQKDGVVSNSSYEEYILNHLQELDKGQYTSSSKIKYKAESEDGKYGND